MPLNLEPKFYPADGKPPGWNKPPGWMVIAAQEAGLDAPRLSHALLRALWAEERDTSKPEFAILSAVTDKGLVQRMVPERLYGLPE